MRIHVVAVAGTGMGSLAGLLRDLGHEVTGSDTAFDPPMGPALEAWGVRCLRGFDPAHLEPPPDLVIVGNVCRRDNPEARAALDGGLDTTHIAGALQRFVLDRTAPLVVAGTHGKTTTTALAAWLLDRTGFEPGYLVGGIPSGLGRSFRSPGKNRLTRPGLGRRTPFVIEGDEYDTAFFEKTAKFLHYRTEVLVLTSIEHDHIDVYPTLERYVDAFRALVEQVPESGLIVAHAADRIVFDVVSRHARAPVAWYALESDDLPLAAHWTGALADADASGTRFDLFAGGVAVGRFASPLAGAHNARNAIAALAAATQGFGAPLPDLRAALASFGGVKRRQELIGQPRGVAVYDDFAHHPTAVRETLAGLRSKHPNARLVAVFEPRSATACRRVHQAHYADAFGGADEVVLAPLGRELPPEESLDLDLLVSELGARGIRASALPSVTAIVEHLAKTAGSGEVIALLSNGAFGGIHGRLLGSLEARRENGESS